MAVSIDTINSLKSLPCFNEIQTISLLANGLSQTALKVTSTNGIFFAKKLNQVTANTEISCSLFCALSRLGGDSKKGAMRQLSPNVIYHDNQWLVTEFIDGITLANSDHTNNVKITTALALMVELHRLDSSITEHSIPLLNPSHTISQLLSNLSPFPAKQHHIIDNVSKCITSELSCVINGSQAHSVICHGDINFENILIDHDRYWLVDFECAYLAPVEFDIAMFIAVNNIPTEQLNEIVTNYAQLSQQYHCNHVLLQHYILYSFFINGLWYLDNQHKDARSQELFHNLAIAQWSSFDSFAIEHAIKMPKLLPLLG